MAYIGVDPNIGDITFQTFTGTGSATAFTLAQSVVSGEALLVTIGNVVQEPGTSKAYTAQGNTLTFSAAPANGDVITVRFFGRAVDQPTSYAMQLFKYVATNNQTAFTGADANGAILAFSGDDVDVYLNGVHLDSSDFTASNGDTITLGTGAATNDELVIRAYRAFTVTDTVSKASGGTFAGAVTFDAGANFGDNDKAQFGAGNDLQIYHDGSHSYIKDNGTGSLLIQGSTAVVIEDPSGNNMAFFEDGGEAILYHNASARLTTKAAGIDVAGSAIMTGTDTFNSNASGAGILLKDSGVTSRQLHIAAPGSVSEAVIGTPNSHNLTFATNNTERMRIESAGNIKISDKFRFTAGGDFEAPATGFSQGTNSKQFAAAIIYSSRSSTSSSAHLAFYNSNGEVGTIATSGSATAYNTSSDYRLKENVADMTGAIDRVKALTPKRFNFIADADTTVDGFLAHEAQAIVPEAVMGTHNEVDEDGNAVMQQIDQSKLVPLLTAALKESIAKIETLEAKVTALENA